jgi:hypothetical protein
MTTLTRFILTFKDENNEVGDLARDLMEDRCAKRTWNYRALKKHMLEHGACEDALAALSLANSAFTRLQREAKQRQASPASRQTGESATASGSR